VDIIEEIEQKRNISACAEVLASLRFDKNLIRQFLREDLMRESAIYQEIIQEGVEQGLQQGLQQGKREEALSYTMRLLARRLGVVAPQLQAQIQELTLAQLEELGEAVLDFTDAKDLVAWLQLH
jgi:predicted transposase YdaD